MTRMLLCLLVAGSTCAACDARTETTTTPTTTSPTTTTLTTRLPPATSISRTFITSQAGLIAVTLRTTGSPTTVLGLGLGVPLGGVANCSLTVSVDTVGGSAPQITSDAAAGSYCVAVYDNGTLTGPADFDLSVTYP